MLHLHTDCSRLLPLSPPAPVPALSLVLCFNHINEINKMSLIVVTDRSDSAPGPQGMPSSDDIVKWPIQYGSNFQLHIWRSIYNLSLPFGCLFFVSLLAQQNNIGTLRSFFVDFWIISSSKSQQTWISTAQRSPERGTKKKMKCWWNINALVDRITINNHCALR